jgi:hypothetical protein
MLRPAQRVTQDPGRQEKAGGTASEQRGLPWDTPELSAMLKDMLQPPSDDGDEFDDPQDETKAAAERAMGSVDEEMDATEASEEWNAAMELEIMKGPRR